MSPPGNDRGRALAERAPQPVTETAPIVTAHPDDISEFRYWLAYYTGRLPRARHNPRWWINEQATR